MLRIMFLFLVFGLLACSPAERPADKSVASSGSECSRDCWSLLDMSNICGVLMARIILQEVCEGSKCHVG